MANNDLVSFCLPDFSKCGPALGDIVPAAVEAFQFFLSMEWLKSECEGTKDFNQNPFFACWFNIPLSLGMYCVPCCCCAICLRNQEKMTGKSCESGCLTDYILGCLCYANVCYYAKKRGEFRKKYGIKGAPLFDCLGACCCMPCMICQDANQLMESATPYNVPYCSLAAAKEMSAKVAPETKS